MGSMMQSLGNAYTKWKDKDPNGPQLPGQKMVDTTTTPMMNQLPSYDKGGDVPADQTAKLHEGERVLNPVETHAYKSAAVGNAPPTLLGRISDRAHEIYNKPVQAQNELGENAEALRAKQNNVEQVKAQMQPLQPNTPPEKSTVGADRIHPNAAYGDHPGEQRLDAQGNVIKPTTPTGMGAVGPKLPEPTALGSKLPSYDDGGDVPSDQVANVHEDEHVLDPDKAAAYRQAEAEVKAEEHGAPADFGGQVIPNPKGIEVKADTDQEKPDYKLQGARMNTNNTPLGKPVMNTSNPPSYEAGNSPVREASTNGKPSPIVPDTKMRNLPSIETPLQSGATDHPNAPQSGNKVIAAGDAAAGYPVHNPPPPTPEEALIKQDKMDAMKSGDLVKLGMANINERMLKVGAGAPGGQVPLPTTTAPTARENVVNQEAQLKDKMINGATEQERFQAEKDLAELKRKTPWGSEGNHPGVLGKIGHAASSIAQGAAQGIAPYVLPAIPGSKANIAEQEAIGETGVEQAQKKESEAANIAIAQGKPELAQAQQRITEEKNQNTANAALRKAGYTKDAAGNAIPIPYGDLSTHEQGVYDLNQAKGNAQNAIADLKRAQAAPNSPQSKLILEKAKAEGQKMDLAGQKLGLDVNKYKADYLGLGPDNEPLPGIQKTEEGKAIGPKVSKAAQAAETTTSMRLNKADLSQNVQLNAANASKMIDEHPDLFGKISGRFTNVAQMTGTDDPAIVQLGIQIHNMAVASAGIHGQRGQAAVEAYEKDILNKFHNSPEATKAALTELSGSVQTFIDDARAGKKVAPTPKTTEEVKSGIPKEATHIYKDKSGKVVGYAQDGKYHALETK
jgi:hypothetical protein